MWNAADDPGLWVHLREIARLRRALLTQQCVPSGETQALLAQLEQAEVEVVTRLHRPPRRRPAKRPR